MSKCAVAAACLSLLLSSVTQAQPNIESHLAEGNLEVTHPVGCIPIDEAQPDYTPADLFPAVSACVAAEDFDQAVALFGLAGVYGRVDIERVSDRTAHQAISVLQQGLFASLDEGDGARMSETLSRTAEDPEKLSGVCSAIRSLGPPSYHPTYMIQHGMGAFTGTKQSTPKGFDLDTSFAKALAGYLKCPEA